MKNALLSFMLLMFLPQFAAAATHVSAGSNYTCMSSSSGLQCWGDGAQIDRTDLTNVTQLVTYVRNVGVVSGGKGFRLFDRLNSGVEYGLPPSFADSSLISVGGAYACQTDGNNASCVGDADQYFRQCSYPLLKSPQKISVSKEIAFSSYGGVNKACAVTQDGLKCWTLRYLWNSPCAEVPVPKEVSNAADISQGSFFSCVLLKDASVKCWGENGRGQTDVPKDLAPTIQISAGWSHACALSETGKVRCWGDDSFGQASVPGDIDQASEISSGYHHTCAVTKQGVKCWGNNSHGELNVPSTAPKLR